MWQRKKAGTKWLDHAQKSEDEVSDNWKWIQLKIHPSVSVAPGLFSYNAGGDKG